MMPHQVDTIAEAASLAARLLNEDMTIMSVHILPLWAGNHEEDQLTKIIFCKEAIYRMDVSGITPENVSYRGIGADGAHVLVKAFSLAPGTLVGARRN